MKERINKARGVGMRRHAPTSLLEHLEHLVILHVVANMFEDVPIRDDTNGTEDNPDRNVDLDISDRCLHDIA